MPDQLAQRAGIGRRQSFRGLPAMNPRAVGQSDPEPAIGHEADDLQRMGAMGARALHGAGGGTGGPEKRQRIGGGVDLAQIVEQDLRRRSRLLAAGRLRVAEITQ